jgi:exportin-T
MAKMMLTPQDIEQYVLLASDASNVQHQQHANTILHQWVTTNDDIVLADTILQLLQTTTREVVLFYALTVFLRLDHATPQQRSTVRQEILSQLLPVRNDNNNNSTPSTVDNNNGSRNNNNYHQSSWSPTYLRTKVGVLFAHFIQLDFPHSWSTAFEELQSPQLIQSSPDIFLRTLIALLEEFGKNETDINANIKNCLRGYATGPSTSTQQLRITNPQQTISGQLIQTILNLLQRSLLLLGGGDGGSEGRGGGCFNGQQQEQEQIQIAILSLTALKGFMSWADLVLLLDETVLQVIFLSIARGSTTNSDVADAAVVAVECMEELIARGMDDEKKVSFLQYTAVLEKIHSHVDLVTVDASPIDVVMEVSKFVNRTGLEILPILNQIQQCEVSSLRAQLIDLFFRCFAYDDIDVSGAVIPMAGSLISSVSDQHRLDDNLLPRLLTTTYSQMKYPPDFQYDFEDDDEVEEEMYRAELRKLNQKLVHANPELCLQFTCQTLAHLPLPLSTAPTPDVEAAISLVYHYCEGIRPPPGMKTVMKNETFRNMLIGIHSSDVDQHHHQEVLLLYYETSVRYYPLLKERTDLLQKVLHSLTGPRGLQHESLKVRSRCCYLLLRLVKSVGSNNANHPNCVLRPYVENAVSGIQNMLGSGSAELRSDDVLNLFETMGLLVGRTGLSPQEQQQYLAAVMTPHVRSIETTLNEKKQVIADDPDMFGEQLSNSVAAIAFLSKGFKSPPPEVQAVLLETLNIALSVLEELASNEQVRNKTLVLVQRLIQCLEGKVLPSMPRLLALLISHCTTEDILDVSQLMNQLCMKFKVEAAVALDACLLPFLQKCHYLSNTIVTSHTVTDDELTSDMAAPHLRIEQLSIQKLNYAVLQHVVVHRVTAILLSPANVSSLEAILQSMGDGAIRVEDPVMKKSCLTFFHELLDQWLTKTDGMPSVETPSLAPPDYVVKGFVQYVCNTLIPGMIQVFLYCGESSFDVDDANCYRCLAEFAGVLYILKNRLPTVYCQEVLVAKFTVQVGLSPSIVEGFQSAGSQKEFEGWLKEMIIQSRQKK